MAGPSDRPRVALIAGPTASGKSALALEMAEGAHGTIVNADSAQVYRDLRILTARPSEADEARVPHLLFGYRDAAEPFSAAQWAADAKAAIAATLADGRLPILVGGTGLYIRTLLDGIAPVPDIDPVIRAEVRRLDTATAYDALGSEDCEAAHRLHPADSTRISRALEVIRSTGRPLASWQAQRTGGIADLYHIDVTLLDPPTSDLYPRCDARMAAMVADGALDEVRALMARRLDPALPAMRAIGVCELGGSLSGETTLAEALTAAQQATRNYAKRQRTWFRHQLTRTPRIP